MAATIDFLPTIAAISGASLPARTIDGVSILPLLEGDPSAEPRTQYYFYYTGELRGVREGRWKRVYSHRTRSYVGVEPGKDGMPGPYAFPTVPAALYDLENDIGETTDVSRENPEIVERLDSLAEAARDALGDRLTGRTGAEVRLSGRRGFQRTEEVSHLAVGALVTLTNLPSPRYPGRGAPTLSDGLLGSRDHHDVSWLGFEATDLEAVVDLGGVKQVRKIGLDCLRAQGSWIFLPRHVDFAVSNDGKAWEQEKRVALDLAEEPAVAVRRVEVELSPAEVRFIRVRAKNVGKCPSWHAGAGGMAWLFVDEIVVS
jgi:hypothetical protein